MTIQDVISRERSKYNRMYSEVPEYSTFSPGETLAPLLLRLAKANDTKNILDVACGRGQLVSILNKAGYDARGIDIVLNGLLDDVDRSKCDEYPVSEMPYKDNQFDMITCIDLLEHIPVDDGLLDKSISEMARVCSGLAVFQIALFKDCFGERIGEVLHPTLMSAEWWLRVLSSRFDVVELVENEGSRIVVFCRKVV